MIINTMIGYIDDCDDYVIVTLLCYCYIIVVIVVIVLFLSCYCYAIITAATVLAVLL